MFDDADVLVLCILLYKYILRTPTHYWKMKTILVRGVTIHRYQGKHIAHMHIHTHRHTIFKHFYIIILTRL